MFLHCDIYPKDLEEDVTSVAGKRFPVDLKKPGAFTNATAEAIKLEMSHDGQKLIVLAKNDEYQEYLYFNIMPPRSGPNDAYRRRMILLFQTFDIAVELSDGRLDLDTSPQRLEAAAGTLFRFGSVVARDNDGSVLTTQNGAPVVNRTLNGRVDKLVPVGGNGKAAQATDDNYDSDIPF
jgi:hypothetical protein